MVRGRNYFKKRLRNYVAFTIILIFVIAFLIISYRNITSHYSIPRKEIKNKELRKYTDLRKNTDLRVIVLAYNRPLNLQKCLNSINEADFNGDNIVLDIWIDRSPNGNIHSETLEVASSFKFTHGTKNVFEQSQHAGIYGQWLNTWNTTLDTTEIAFYLEDDVIVSPFFYRWLGAAHRKYAGYTEVNGFSLQGERIKHREAPGNLKAPPGNIVFEYPVLGSWGFSPVLKKWKHFLKWYNDASRNKSFMPTVPNILPSQWYMEFKKMGKSDSMWTMWHIYHAYKNDEWTIYPNLPHDMGFTSNTKPKGSHKQDPGRSYAVVTQWNEAYIEFPDKPVRLDFNGNVIKR